MKEYAGWNWIYIFCIIFQYNDCSLDSFVHFFASVHCCFSNFISSFLFQKLTEQGSLALAATNCKRTARGDKPSPKSDVVGVGAAPKPTRATRALTAERIVLCSNSRDGL